MKDRILLLASLASSLVVFRGALIQALIDQGLEVHVAAPDLLKDPSAEVLRDKGVILHDIPLRRAGMNPVSDFSSFLAINSLLRTIRPKYFLGYTVKPVIYGLLAARLAGVSRRFALITGLGYAFTGNAKGKRALAQMLVRSLYKISLAGAHKVFFQNPDDMELFIRLRLVSESIPKVVVNGSGIELDKFPLSPPVDKSVNFLLIARLLGDKGVREYVDAARYLLRRYSGVTCSLVGWVDENPDAIGIDELNAWINEGVIDYLGRLSDVRPAIASASVYVLPSYREGTPRTVLEAMSMGKPIITTNAPGCRETVSHGVNGFLVPVKDSAKLAEAMERFIVDPDLIAIMGQESRQIAIGKYDVHKVNSVMLREMGIIL